MFFFQYGREPVLIQRILFGFEAILEKTSLNNIINGGILNFFNKRKKSDCEKDPTCRVGKKCRVQGGVKKSSAADWRHCGQRA